jgi:hypothetical protein
MSTGINDKSIVFMNSLFIKKSQEGRNIRNPSIMSIMGQSIKK